MSEMKEAKDSKEMKYSLGIHASYGLGGFLDNFIQAAFTTRLFFYYSSVLNLNLLYLGIAYGIFGVWNMFNDVLLGNLSDRKYSWTKKWGRRFPWFTFGILTYAVSYWALFAAPFPPGTTLQLEKFLWCLITLLVFEFLFSLWQINWLSIFPDKYRTTRERNRIGVWTTIWGVVGIVLGVLLPPLLLGDDYKNQQGYFIIGVMVAVITLIGAIASIPGMREDRELIDRQLEVIKRKEEKERQSFIEILKSCFKDKNFLAYVITYMGHQVMTVFLLGILPFWTSSVLMVDPDNETIIGLFFLIAVLAGTPFWSFIGKKYGNKKAFMIGTFMTTWFFIPLWFVGMGDAGLILTSICLALIGFGIGAIWVLMYPCFSDVMDNIVVNAEDRKEGAYTGIRTFFGRFSFVLQALFFSLILWATGFNPYVIDTAIPQTGTAIIGIKILMALIPQIFYFLGFLLMWRVYSLDMSCVAENRELLEQKIL
ncbi:MAG: putative Na+/melibiose symporter-like transporter [Promethearchaeota archaeon]|nr:MAG: putative Na+/melibiose symporter-like transporter [Candidatus Lokiarchaeota archaeon]